MSLVAKTLNVIAETIRSPNSLSLINRVTGSVIAPGTPLPPGTPPPSPLGPAFKWTFIVVVLLTVLSGIATIVLASIWIHPTPNQQTTFDSFAFAWKVGIGAIFGLLGGKVT
jgi:hypothetical protein